MKIEDYVERSLFFYEIQDYKLALLLACIAVEATVRKSEPNVTRSSYAKFVNDYEWLICAFINRNNLSFDTSMLPDITNDEGKPVKKDIGSYIYSVYRCSLAHGKELPQGFNFPSQGDGWSSIYLDNERGILILPPRIILSLLAICVFSKNNRDITTQGTRFLSWGSDSYDIGWYKFPINKNWGREAEIEKLLKSQPDGEIIQKLPEIPQHDYYHQKTEFRRW